MARDKQSDNEKGCEQASSLDGLLFLIIYDLLFNFILYLTIYCMSLIVQEKICLHVISLLPLKSSSNYFTLVQDQLLLNPEYYDFGSSLEVS